MKTKLLLLVSAIILWNSPISAQRRSITTSTIPQKIKSNKRPSEKKTDNLSLFNLYDNPYKQQVEKDIKNAVFFKLDFAKLATLKAENRSSLTLDLPLSAEQTATFHLKSVKLLADDFKVVNDKNETVPYTPGLYYQGTLAGNTPSLAAWSLFDNSVITVFSWQNDNYNLGVWKHPSNTQQDIYILYKDKEVQFPHNFECSADKLPKSEHTQAKSLENTPQQQFTNCIKIYFECDYQMYQDNNNSTTNVANFVTGMFNVVQTIYTNETIGVEISEIYTWTTSDPYNSTTSSSDILNDFQNYRTSFNGDLAHLLSTRNIGAGGIAYVDALCFQTYAYGYSNIDNDYDLYPTYSWTIEVVSHELGHNFGSEHTHWCGWVGGPIDNCVAVDGGPCSPGPTPTNGGTIMSYCHLSNVGILLTNGFGTQPGNKIRTQYNAASCLTACAPTDPVCSNATTISGCDSVNLQTFNGGGTGSWNNSSASACGNAAPGSEKVYTFVAPSTGTYSIKVTAASGNMHYAWKTAPCGPTGWTCIGNISTIGQYGTMSWTAGTTYYIMLDDENTTTGAHSFYIKCPVNTGGGGNPCANIVSISACGSTNTQNFVGDTVGSWNSSTATTCGFSAQGKETIYSFVAPTTGIYNLTITSASGYVDYFWKTSACDSTGWTCIIDTNVTGTFGNLSWTAGTTYYILLDDEAVGGTASLHSFYLNCPVDPNPCGNITAIAGCGSTSTQTFSGGITGNWNSSVASVCGYAAPGPEKIYSFVAPTTGTYNITITAASGYVDYFWKTSACDSTGWTCIIDTNVTGTFGNLSWTAGTTYYILLDDEAVGSTASSHSFYIDCPNNNTSGPCANIITINNCGSSSTQTFVGDTIGSWHTTIASACGTMPMGKESVYSYTPTVSGNYSINITAASGPVSYFWKTGSCDSLGWNCIVDTNTTGQYGTLSFTAGTTYYILLDDNTAGINPSTHSFYITCASNSNDPCSNPTAIANCGPNNLQTYTGGGNGVWHTSSNNACSQISLGTEQVFSFTPTTTGVYNINVTAANGYVSYLWKTATCSSTGWSCIGNINASGLYGILSMTSGTTYYIMLDDHDSTVGTHTFYIECIGSNPCANATAISGCGTANTQSYTGGGTGSWYTNNNNPCGFASTGTEAIYTFAPASSGTYSIEVTAASGKVGYMWKAASCAPAGWTCIDDVSAPGTYGTMTWNVGTTYYLLLDDENSTTGTHSFYINCANNPSGIEEYDPSKLAIFPNPSNGNFTIVIDGLTQEKLELEVVNMLGEAIYSYQNANVSGKFNKEIALTTVAKGIYTISLKRGSKTYHKKIIVE